jgi:hypothetical protein
MSNTATAAKTNVLAIVSLVTSILGFSLVGIITGHIGLSQIKKSGEAGSGLAIAGLVIGYISIVALVLFIFFFGAAFIAAAMSGQLNVS